jgi:hypothetical protein
MIGRTRPTDRQQLCDPRELTDGTQDEHQEEAHGCTQSWTEEQAPLGTLEMLASRLVLDHVGTRPRLHELRTDGDACQIGDDRFFCAGRNDGTEATDLVHVRPLLLSSSSPPLLPEIEPG